MKRRSNLRSQNGLGASNIARALSIPAIGNGASSLALMMVAGVLLLSSVLMPDRISDIRMNVADAIAPAMALVVKPVANAADVLRNVSGLAELQAENNRLSSENMKLKEWYQTALLLESENQSLRELLNVKIEPQYKTITARVLSDSSSTFAKTMLVAAGSKDGVRKGQAVMSADGLIGRIVEVGNATSRLLMITDINSRVPVLIEDTRQHAVMAGVDNISAKLVHMSENAALPSNARIITSGHGGVFPPGLPVGRITQGDKLGISVQPFADINRLVHVRIIDSLDYAAVFGPVKPIQTSR